MFFLLHFHHDLTTSSKTILPSVAFISQKKKNLESVAWKPCISKYTLPSNAANIHKLYCLYLILDVELALRLT